MGKKRRGGKQAQLQTAGGAEPVASAPATALAAPAVDGPVDPTVLASVLQADFPLVDSSLILAIVGDFDPATLGDHVSAIRDQLGELQAHSVPEGDVDGGGNSGVGSATWARGRDATSETSSRSRPFVSTDATSLGTDTADGDVDESGPGSEADLLAVFFPNLRAKDIAEALASEPSLEKAIDYLLSTEMIRGVQRTGVWADEDPADEKRDGEWKPVVRRRSSANSAGTSMPPVVLPPKPQGKKGKKKTVTLPLVDTLQRRATPTPSSSGASTPSSAPAAGDVWSAFSSLAAFLADTTHTPPTYYTSYLHSPEYGSAHEAVLTALGNLASTRNASPPPEVLSILENMYGTGDGDDEADAAVRAAVGAADGDVSATMDLMDALADLTEWPDYLSARSAERDPWDILSELEGSSSKSRPSSRVSSATSSRPNTPLSASTPVLPPTSAPTRALNSNRLKRPETAHKDVKGLETAHKDAKPAPSLVRSAKARTVPGSIAAPSGYTQAHEANLPSNDRWAGPQVQSRPNVDWKTVAPRQRRNAHPLAASIPAYGRAPGATSSVGRYGDGGDSTTTSSSSAALSSADCYDRGEREWERRRAAMLAGGAAFRRGGRKDHAALVAGFYAAEARDAGLSARAWQLRGARIETDSQLASGQIDLHFRTVEQARALALDAASKWYTPRPASTTTPLKIVTGKGLHSAGAPVLGPAVARVLRDEGWRIVENPGYISVLGR